MKTKSPKQNIATKNLRKKKLVINSKTKRNKKKPNVSRSRKQSNSDNFNIGYAIGEENAIDEFIANSKLVSKAVGKKIKNLENDINKIKKEKDDAIRKVEDDHMDYITAIDKSNKATNEMIKSIVDPLIDTSRSFAQKYLKLDHDIKRDVELMSHGHAISFIQENAGYDITGPLFFEQPVGNPTDSLGKYLSGVNLTGDGLEIDKSGKAFNLFRKTIGKQNENSTTMHLKGAKKEVKIDQPVQYYGVDLPVKRLDFEHSNKKTKKKGDEEKINKASVFVHDLKNVDLPLINTYKKQIKEEQEQKRIELKRILDNHNISAGKDYRVRNNATKDTKQNESQLSIIQQLDNETLVVDPLDNDAKSQQTKQKNRIASVRESTQIFKKKWFPKDPKYLKQLAKIDNKIKKAQDINIDVHKGALNELVNELNNPSNVDQYDDIDELLASIGEENAIPRPEQHLTLPQTLVTIPPTALESISSSSSSSSIIPQSNIIIPSTPVESILKSNIDSNTIREQLTTMRNSNTQTNNQSWLGSVVSNIGNMFGGRDNIEEEEEEEEDELKSKLYRKKPDNKDLDLD